jgi:hypothetical protein
VHAGVQYAFGLHEWRVGIVDAPAHTFLEPGARPQVRWTAPTRQGEFLADPFGVVRDETLNILAEHYRFDTTRGCIAALTGGDRESVTDVIELPVHMAYPYLVEEDGDIYCVPSIPATGKVILYRAVDFPRRWERAAVLLDTFAGTDPTIIRHDGRWWLWCSGGEVGSNTKLHAWHSPDLFGPWTEHPLNPLKTDIRSARPAGTPFTHEGRLYRPAQDSARTYGGRIVLNEVTTLTPTRFEEVSVAHIDPYQDSPYPDGLHTLCAVGDVTIIDSKREILTVRTLGRRARYLVRKLTRRLPEHASYS